MTPETEQKKREVLDSEGKILSLDNPEPGIYYGIPFVSYKEISAINQSTLGMYKEGPEKVLFKAPPTDSMIFGTQYHSFLMEPDEFDSLFVEGPKDKRGKNKDIWKMLAENHGPELIYSESSLQNMRDMKKFLLEYYPLIAPLLINDSPTEITVIWVDPVSGATLKCRIDKPMRHWNTFVDLKTTRDALKFSNSVNDYGYDYQGRFYQRGLEANGWSIDNFVIVAQEKKYPYIVRSHKIASRRLEACDEEIDRDIANYVKWVNEGKKIPNEVTILE